MKKASGAEVTHAAQSQALMDMARDICDPHGTFNNWLLVNGFWTWTGLPLTAYSPELEKRANNEKPIAYKLWVKSYLVQQGWMPRV